MKRIIIIVLFILCATTAFAIKTPPPQVIGHNSTLNIFNMTSQWFCLGGQCINAWNTSFNITSVVVNTTIVANNLFNYTNIKGSDMTLTDGLPNRQYTKTGIKFVSVDTTMLHPEIDYSFAADVLTIKNKIWDDQDITLYYVTDNNNTMIYTNYYGNALTGVEGNINRQILSSNPPLLIIVDTYSLQPEIDYSFSGGVITFKNKIWNDQVITVWHN